MKGAEISKQCACGGSLAVPSIFPEDRENNGYDPCPECTKLFPHVLNEAQDACIYCGQFYPDGPCPSANHPNLDKEFEGELGDDLPEICAVCHVKLGDQCQCKVV